METNEYLMSAAKNAPRQPGVYLMKDGDGKILYVGKARDLRARLRSYAGGTDGRFMIPFLVSRVRHVEVIVTASEKEALLLENNCIKEHRPRYNVDFRDDKTYFHIRLDLEASFPRFQLVRRPRRDRARYFGPYPSSASARKTLQVLQPVFPLRTCRDRDFRLRRRPCLEHELGRCAAPCVGNIDAATYGTIVRDALAFLEGKTGGLLAGLEARMKDLAGEERFEEAAALRDRLHAVRNVLERQRVDSMSGKDQDVFGLYREGRLTQVCTLFVRAGKVVGQRVFPLIKLTMTTGEILAAILKQFYDGAVSIPREILLPEALDERAVLAEWLTESRGRAVILAVPGRGQGAALVRLATQNAQQAFDTQRRASGDTEEVLQCLAAELSLRKPPRRIECFDISNLGGSYAVGSMVTFLDGRPAREAYRRFRIRNTKGPDDYAMMYEVLSRRLQRHDLPVPDLLMVDGGRGQLAMALSALKDAGMGGVEAVGIAKADEAAPLGRNRRIPAKGEDRIYLAQRKLPVYLSRWPAALFLLQRIRDEAHRFALTYHRRLREAGDLQSLLDRIEGIGPVLRGALLERFGDLARLRAAGVQELMETRGIGRARAEALHGFLQGRTESQVSHTAGEEAST